MSKLFLVTGGTGFLGRPLVRRLIQKGHRVRVLDNDWRGAHEKLADVRNKYEFVQGDIRDAAVVRKACRGVDTICHLAFINGTEYFYSLPELVLEVGVQGMMNVVQGAIQEDVPELITASSSEVYQVPPSVPTKENVPLVIPDPLNPRYSYGGGKILSELITLNYGRKFFKRAMIFRPHNVFGPDMGWEHVIPQFVVRMKMMADKNSKVIRFPIQGTGRETRAFVYIDDFTDGLMKVIEKGEHLNIYHIGTNVERSIQSVAMEVARYFRRTIKIIPGTVRLGSTPRRCPHIGKLKKLGYRPRVPFSEALRRTAAWYDQNLNLAPPSLKRGDSI